MQLPPDARQVTVAFARLPRWIDGFGERHGEVRTAEGDEVVELSGADGDRAWIQVPFPPRRGTLLEHVARPRTVAVLLVRRGGHAAGVFEISPPGGATLVASKVGSSYVQGGTKAGGWSQQRYARRRANQAGAAFADAADAAAGVLLGHRLDALVLGGDRPAVRAVLEDRRLQALEALVTGPWLEVKDPRLRVLQATPEQFLATRIALVP